MPPGIGALLANFAALFTVTSRSISMRSMFLMAPSPRPINHCCNHARMRSYAGLGR